MGEYVATIEWRRYDAVFTDNRYSRAHMWAFDGGLRLPASASPHVVRAPYSDPDAIDPEEAFVAAISSCHMLTFLHIAAQQNYVVDSYLDEAVGVMEKNADGKQAVTRVTLKPRIEFAGERTPDRAQLDTLHHEAHEACFIANSVRTEILVENVDP
ncbi:MAG: OsmC family protein [Methyloligellaceae bacterium]